MFWLSSLTQVHSPMAVCVAVAVAVVVVIAAIATVLVQRDRWQDRLQSTCSVRSTFSLTLIFLSFQSRAWPTVTAAAAVSWAVLLSVRQDSVIQVGSGARRAPLAARLV